MARLTQFHDLGGLGPSSRLPARITALCLGSGDPGTLALQQQTALELGEGTKHRQHHLARG